MEYVPQRFNRNLINENLLNSENIVIAVLDTGVDPLAYGLRTTPNGLTKVIDVIDCTGSDTINTSKIKKYDELNKNIKDLIGDQITNKNQINFGMRSLRSFISKRSSKEFDEETQKTINEIIFFIYTYKIDNEYVVIVESENETWKMKEYNINYETGSVKIGKNITMTFCVHVYEDGNATSLVFDCGSHGTHVAGIIAGYFSDNLEQNGINPNARILSLKIGDSRVNGMETSVALVRALDEMVKYKCTLANYSFGESVDNESTMNTSSLNGSFINKLKEYVNKYNIIFVTSAGNSGPTLMTVGAPRMCSESCISVGACTDDTLLKKMYFLSENGFDKGMYEWSSRGPLFNKSMGVDLIAPGVALTSYPSWYKSNLERCNGTSMACPNAVGIISLIMQTYVDNGRNLPFYWVKKYFENTCEPLDIYENISQGKGMILNKQLSTNPTKIRKELYKYEICSNKNQNYVGEFIQIDRNSCEKNNGIYIHNLFIKITPTKLKDSDDIDMTTLRKKLCVKSSFSNVELNIVDKFIVDSRSTIVRAQLILNVRNMKNLTSKFIDFYEEEDLNNFVGYYPVNIIVYDKINNEYNIDTSLKPGVISRHYIMPSSNNIEINIDNVQEYNGAILFVDVAKITDIQKYDDTTRINEKYYSSKLEMTKSQNIRCVPNMLYEVCIYLPWSVGINKLIEYNVKLKLKCSNVLTTFDKTFAYVNENIYITTNKICGENDSEIVSNYQPIDYAISKNLESYVLTLKYKINKHTGKNTYYVNECNKVYNSDVQMSACIFGYKNNKLVFMGNYKEKTYDGDVDEIIIKIGDSEKSKIEKYIELPLKIKRKLKKSLKITKEIMDEDKLLVVLKMDKQTLFSNNEVYIGDLIYTKFNDIEFTIMNQFTNNCNLIKTNDKTNISLSEKLQNIVKKFKLILSWIDKSKIENEKNDIIKELSEIVQEKDKLLHSDTLIYQMLISLFGNILESDIQQSTIEQSTIEQSTDAKNINNRRNFYEVILLNKLEKTAPFCAYKLLWKLMEPQENILIGELMDVLDEIKTNMSYWNDLNETECAIVSMNILNQFDGENNYTSKKRKLEYLCEGEYEY